MEITCEMETEKLDFKLKKGDLLVLTNDYNSMKYLMLNVENYLVDVDSLDKYPFTGTFRSILKLCCECKLVRIISANGCMNFTSSSNLESNPESAIAN